MVGGEGKGKTPQTQICIFFIGPKGNTKIKWQSNFEQCSIGEKVLSHALSETVLTILMFSPNSRYGSKVLENFSDMMGSRS